MLFKNVSNLENGGWITNITWMYKIVKVWSKISEYGIKQFDIEIINMRSILSFKSVSHAYVLVTQI